MTCIVGIEHETGVYIGGDSAGVAGWTVVVRADSKVFRVGEFLIGIAGCFRMGNLLRYAFDPPALPVDDADLERYMVAEFVPAVRAVLENGGQRKKEAEVESMAEGSFLVGVRGRLFQIGDDFQVGRNAAGYDAIGSGSLIALGALYCTGRGFSLAPPDRIGLALRAAEAHNIGVRAPFVIEVLLTTTKAPAPAASE